MTGVRARKTRRNRRVNTTRPAQKKRNEKKRFKIANKTVDKHWDHTKTMKQNFKELGLSCDVNVTIPVVKKKKKTEENEEDTMEVESTPTPVVQEFEKLALLEQKTERRIAPGEAQFVWKLIQKYGNDYKAMVRDKSNVNQHTPNQLKRKCEAFLRSSQDFSQHL